MKIWNAIRTWYFSLPASKKRLLRNVLVRSTLILMALVLAVEAYYAYRFYEDSYSNSQAAGSRSSSAETSGAESGSEVVFVHQATPQNIAANSTYLSSPLTDGEPEALISVTQSWNPGGGAGVYNAHLVGVWYDSGRDRWAIFNQDLAPMPQGAAFNVVVWAESG